MATRRLVRPLASARIVLPPTRPSCQHMSAPHSPRPPDSASMVFASGTSSRFSCPTLSYAYQNKWWSTFLSGSGARGFSSGDLPPHIILGMPALSPTMTQGNVVNWKKKEGDQVSPGDVLCVIETDKATVDFESVEEGFLAKIVVPSGSNNVPVGQTIGVMVESADDIAKVASSNFGAQSSAKTPHTQGETSPKPSPASQSSPKPSPTVDLPPHIVIGMPALSPTMTQGNVVNWKKKEGDQVSPGDVLCLIETDKATVDLESVEEGYLAKILVPAGSSNVPIGQTIGVLVEDADDISKVASAGFVAQPSAKKSEAQAQASAKPSSAVSKPSFETSKPSSASFKSLTRVGPSVRRLLTESGLDAASINGTGPRGVVLKGDVLAAMRSGGKAQKQQKATPAQSPPTALSFEDKPTSQIRKIIAKRLIESKFGIPHFYLSADAILDRTLVLRKEMKEKHGVAVSVNDFIIRATALALKAVPEANAYWEDKAGEIVFHSSIDISIAVATDKGLITPIVRNADLKSLSTISTEVKSLAEKARNGKLKPEEFQGGTFSISNLGMFAVDRFSAIINPPQACILAVGRGEKAVIWEDCPDSGLGRPRTVTRMGMSLSADNRVFDTSVGGRFLDTLAANLEDPKRMLL